MRFETLANVVLTMLAAAFVTAFSAWIAVAMHRADLFMPLTWTAAALASPAVLGGIILTLRLTLARLGLMGTAFTAVGLGLAIMAFGPQAVLFTIPVAIAVILPSGMHGGRIQRRIG